MLVRDDGVTGCVLVREEKFVFIKKHEVVDVSTFRNSSELLLRRWF